MNRVLYLDFEGSHAKGVREIGYLITEDDKITKPKRKMTMKQLNVYLIFQKDKFEYIVAHNAFVEKNLIKKYFPYYLDTKTKKFVNNYG